MGDGGGGSNGTVGDGGGSGIAEGGSNGGEVPSGKRIEESTVRTN